MVLLCFFTCFLNLLNSALVSSTISNSVFLYSRLLKIIAAIIERTKDTINR